MATDQLLIAGAVERILKEYLLEALPISAREDLKSGRRRPVKSTSGEDLHCPIDLINAE
jgi:hypothetical protein